MRGHYLGRASVVVAISVAVLSACAASDPANEEPAVMTPGNYQIAWSGPGPMSNRFMQNGPGPDNQDICMSAPGRDSFPDLVARSYQLHPGCTRTITPRQGNAIGGVFTCPMADERMPGGRMTITYQGVVSTEKVELTARMATEFPPALLAAMPPEQRDQLVEGADAIERIDLNVTATRTGDCR